jgi:hypothetical protein
MGCDPIFIDWESAIGNPRESPFPTARGAELIDGSPCGNGFRLPDPTTARQVEASRYFPSVTSLPATTHFQVR